MNLFIPINWEQNKDTTLTLIPLLAWSNRTWSKADFASRAAKASSQWQQWEHCLIKEQSITRGKVDSVQYPKGQEPAFGNPSSKVVQAKSGNFHKSWIHTGNEFSGWWEKVFVVVYEQHELSLLVNCRSPWYQQ